MVRGGLVLSCLAALFSAQANASSFTNVRSLLQAINEGYIYDQQGKKLPETEVNSPAVAWKILGSAEGQAYKSIGLLYSAELGFACSAALLDVGGGDLTPAYALTAGHCLKNAEIVEPDTNKVYTSIPVDVSLYLNHFIDAKGQARAIKVHRFVYSTMKGTDIAILQLEEPYEKLKAEGFHGFRLAKKPVQAGDRLTLVGVPLNGVSEGMTYLRKADCTVQAVSTVAGRLSNQNDAIFRMNKTILHDCSAVEGSSGAPLLSESGEIVGVMSWVKDFMSTQQLFPDETTRQYQDFNGAAASVDFAGCFAAGRFNVYAKGCTIEKPCFEGNAPVSCALKSCEWGNGASCLEAAGILLQNVQDDEQARTGLQLIEMGCRLGDSESCRIVGDILISEKDKTEVVLQGLQAYIQSCAVGGQSSCYKAGLLFAAGIHGEEGKPRAMGFFDQSCRMGYPLACDKVAEAYLAAKVPQKAAELFAKACEKGSALGCSRLASLYEKGQGVPRSPANAKKFKAMACEYGDKASCPAGK